MRALLPHTRTHPTTNHPLQAQLGLSPSEERGGYVQYLVPREREGALPGALRELERRAGEMGVGDVQISLTTLEEVFLNIARKVGGVCGGGLAGACARVRGSAREVGVPP